MQLPSLFSGGGGGGGAFLAEGTGMKPPIDPHDSVGILLYFCPRTTIYLFVFYYICVLKRRMRSGDSHISVLEPLHVFLMRVYMCFSY